MQHVPQRFWSALAIAALVVTSAHPHAQRATSKAAPTVADDEAVVGAWVLDTAKSKFSPGPAPTAETRSYEYQHEGLKARIVTSDADGHQSSVEYVASYNDVVALVTTGSENVDTIKMRKIDSRTAESTLLYMGKAVGVARRVVSADGKTMTITFRRDAPTKVNNVAVYRRQ